MRTGVTVHLSPTDRKRLQAIVDDHNSLQKMFGAPGSCWGPPTG